MINRVNTVPEGIEFLRRLSIEMTDSGLAVAIPSPEDIRRIVTAGDLVAMDNGLSPTFAGADRICIVLQKERDPVMPPGWWVTYLFGPTGALRPDGFGSVHAGIGRWVTQRAPVRFPALFPPGTFLMFRRGRPGFELPMIKMAIALAVPAGVVEQPGGIFRFPIGDADAQMAANGVTAVAA